MPGLNIFTSNKLEVLAEQLARLMKTPVSSAFNAEIIVVQSTGMQRWVSLALAQHNGICANVQFPFPNSFLEDIARRVMPDFPQLSPFDPDILMFKIMKILPDCIRQKGFKHLKSYLADDDTRLKRLQLSSKLADLYDQYQVFRPEMIMRWEQGMLGAKDAHPGERWQAHLWKQISNSKKSCHRAGLQRALIKKITAAPHQMASLPQRIFVFGISYLPIFHLEALMALSQLIDMNLFLLNPCREYWSDIFSERQMQRIMKNYPPSTDTRSALHLEEGNRLLASMGTHGRDFFSVISDFDIQIQEFYQDPGSTNMLSCIQSDILNLRERKVATDSTENQRKPVSATEMLPPNRIDSSDTSIQIHCCHSPMREIEVLHDNLLAMFDEDPSLGPKDIVVMTPDIDVYAPYIQAVFEAQTNERLRIPFSMADQNARSQHALIEGFLSLLDLKGSRVSAARVMRLLESPAIKDQFGLYHTDLTVVERWIRDTRIRWGVDGASRKKMGLPAISENTWWAGIQQLLLGYALPGKKQRMFEGILPYDKIEGNETQSFGKFLEFTDRVFKCVKDLDRPKQLKQWSATLKKLLDDFFKLNDETERELQRLKTVMDDLGNRQNEAGIDEKFEFEPIRFYLEQRIENLNFKSGFIAGGVTFCAMLPMRSIPFKVVCLVGMNSDRFPRKFQPLAFDLIAQHPQPGDRSRRNDDKYLFLESIISARQKLYISYVGQSIQDNSRMPPSVLVSELLDTIEQGFDLPGQDIRQHVVTFHRLQGFSSHYFKDNNRLFSYSKENRDAAVCLNKFEDPAPLITSELPLTATEKEAFSQLDIETLCLFFSNPARFLLKQRLGIFLDQAETVSEKREDFELNFLDQYRVGQDLLRSRLEGRNLETFRPLQVARGQLPHAKVGTFHYNEMSIDIERFVGKIESFRKNKTAEHIESQIEVNDVCLQVRLPEIYEQGLIHVRYAKKRAQDILRSWIYHLAFCEMKLPDQPASSMLIFKNAAWQLNPVEHHRKYLVQLLTLFKRGLEKPLHFFPNSSLEYIQQKQMHGKSKRTALNAAQRKWRKSEFARGESDDPYYDICFRQYDPLDESFQEISETVFKPVLTHYTDLEI